MLKKIGIVLLVLVALIVGGQAVLYTFDGHPLPETEQFMFEQRTTPAFEFETRERRSFFDQEIQGLYMQLGKQFGIDYQKGSKLSEGRLRLDIEPNEGGMCDEIIVADRRYDRSTLTLEAGAVLGWRVG